MNEQHNELVKIYAQFLNDGIKLAVSIMLPIWNGSPNKAYSCAIDGAGILERISMWSNEYISGPRENDFETYFLENIEAVRTDRRYVNNKDVQEFCNQYKLKIKKINILEKI